MAVTNGFAASSREGGFAGAGTSRLESPLQRPSVTPGAGNISVGRVPGEGGNRAIGAGFRGPATTWGTEQSVVPGSALGLLSAQPASPMAPYGNAFDFTPEELTASLISMNKARLPDAGMWALGTLRKQLQEPQNIAMSEALGAPFAAYQAAGPSFSVPSGILGNELNASLPPAGTVSNQPTMTADDTSFDGVQQSVLPDFTFGNPADSLETYGWMFDNPDLPIGMRNFNPGNLKYTGSSWQANNLFGISGPSKYTDQGDPQIQFSDPVSGMASAVRLALAKQSQGMDTVSKIVTNPNGWTPGNTAAANNIAKTMGVDPNAKINLQDPITMDKFMKALVRQEHGPSSAQYGQDVYNAGINVAFSSYGLGNPNLKNAVAQAESNTTSASGGLLGGARAEGNTISSPSPAPSPVQTASSPNTGLLGGAGRDGGQLFAGAPVAPADLTRVSNFGTQLLAGSQPQVVEPASALEAPPVNRPKGEPTRLASLLVDRAIARNEDRRRRKRSTTSQDTMTDTIGGLLA